MTAIGYDRDFLGLPVAMPTVADQVVELPYVHFTVMHRADRRLAAITAVNVHGGLLVDIERHNDRWELDDRIPDTEQAGPALYANNHFDRGHLVRRRDPGWGPQADAANQDTFHYTNCAPQVDVFNQGKELWSGLEDYLLDHAAKYERRLTVFTGPVLAADDPIYRGVPIPLRFWKIVAWLQDTQLASSAYLLDQTDLVHSLIAAQARVAGAEEPAPPLGQYRTFQVPVGTVLADTGMHAADLDAADVLKTMPSIAEVGEPIELTSYADIRLGV